MFKLFTSDLLFYLSSRWPWDLQNKAFTFLTYIEYISSPLLRLKPQLKITNTVNRILTYLIFDPILTQLSSNLKFTTFTVICNYIYWHLINCFLFKRLYNLHLIFKRYVKYPKLTQFFFLFITSLYDYTKFHLETYNSATVQFLTLKYIYNMGNSNTE